MELGASASTGQSNPQLPKGRAKSCTSCRQVKLKCDVREKYPHACTRCRDHQLECKMDSTFKRVPARRQLKEVSEKLSNLERSLGVGGAGTSQSPRSTLSPGSSGSSQQFRSMPRLFPDLTVTNLTLAKQEAMTGDTQPMAMSTQPQGWLNLRSETPEQDNWTIGHISICGIDVVDLFTRFESIYYRFVPFLERVDSIQALSRASPLLFWTIIMIGLRGRPDLRKTREGLSQFHKNLLLSKMLEVPVQLKTLHAVLLTTTWPYFVTHTLEDISYSLMGNAVSMATLMGLHEPGREGEFHSVLTTPVQVDPHIRSATWLACFNLSCTHAFWLGYVPPLLNPIHLDTISRLCKDTTLPLRLRAQGNIHLCSCRAMQSLDSSLDLRNRHALILLFEREFDQVREIYGQSWSDELEVELLGAKMFLYGYSFVPLRVETGFEVPVDESTLNHKEILQRGLSTSVRLLHIVRTLNLDTGVMLNTHQPTDVEYFYRLGSFPKHVFRTISIANTYLLFFLAVDHDISPSDRELARTYVTATHRMFASFRDAVECQRYATLVEVLGRMPSRKGRSLLTNIRSRRGISFIYDLLREATAYRESMRHLEEASEPSQMGSVVIENLPDRRSSGVHAMAPPPNGLGPRGAPQFGSTSMSISPPPPTMLQHRHHEYVPNMDPPLHLSQGRYHHSNPHGGLALAQLPLPTYPTFTNTLPPQTIDAGGNLIVDFPWGEWDPQVFDSMMELDFDLAAGGGLGLSGGMGFTGMDGGASLGLR